MKMLKKDKILVAWLIVVFLGIVLPGEELPDLGRIYYFDKIVHMILFGLVTFLVNESMKARGFEKRPAAVISLLAGATYAGLAEIIQLFVPGRSCSIYDFYAGIIGGIIALVVIYCRKAH